MSGVVGMFAIGGSRIPCEPQIALMAGQIAQNMDHSWSFSDHRLRLEAVINPLLDQSSFQCPETGTVVWLHGHFDNQAQLLSRLSLAQQPSLSQAKLLASLYQSKGLLALPMLRGRFAAMIWDPLEQRLLLLRDQLGLHNLYFSLDGDHLWFSSSPDALGLQQPRTLDLQALNTLVMTGGPAAGRTLWHKIESLKPGEVFIAEHGRVRRSCFWQFVYEEPFQITASLVKGFRATGFRDAGLLPADSAALQQCLGASVDQVIHASAKQPIFLAQVEGSSGVLNCLFQRQSRHQVIAAQSVHEACLDFRALVQMWGQPFGDFSQLNLACLMAQAISARNSQSPSQHLALGIGEDVLFGLHSMFRQQRWQERYARQADNFDRIDDLDPLAVMRPLLRTYAVTKHYLQRDFVDMLEASGLSIAQNLPLEWHDWSDIGQLQAGLLRWHVQPTVSACAQLARRYDLQCHMPYLQIDVVEFIAKIQPELHRKGVQGGQILRQTYSDMMKDLQCSRSMRIGETLPHASESQLWQSIWPACCELLSRPTTAPLEWPQVQILVHHCQSSVGRLKLPERRALIFLASFLVWTEQLYSCRV